MKNLALLLAVFLTGVFGVHALHTTAGAAEDHHVNPAFGYGNSFIFEESGVVFSVFPDGEFDFYVNNSHYAATQANISFNAGYNYNNYLQYDDYGSVIQVMNTPVFYDYYGRVAQIGQVRIFYNNRRIIRIGSLNVFYNPYGVYSHCTGYINSYNRVYVYRPFHRFFVRPVTRFCMVSYQPYRQYYVPIRYTYYRPYVNNVRVCYASVGNTYYYKKNNSKQKIYVNDRRVSRRSYTAYYNDTASRRGASKYANNNTKVSKRSYANQPQKRSGTNYENSRNKASKRQYTNTQRTRGNSTTQKKRSNDNTQIKRYQQEPSKKVSRGRSTVKQAPSKKVSRGRSAVKQAPSKKAPQKTQYRSGSTRTSKKAVRSSTPQKRTVSKTKGRKTRSRM